MLLATKCARTVCVFLSTCCVRPCFSNRVCFGELAPETSDGLERPITFARISDKDAFMNCLDKRYHDIFGSFEKYIAREFQSAIDLLGSPSQQMPVSSMALAYTCRLLLSSVLVSGETVSYHDAKRICGQRLIDIGSVFSDVANSSGTNAHAIFMETFLRHLASVPSPDLDQIFKGENVKTKLDFEVDRLELGPDNPQATFLVGPSASGKSYNAKVSGLVATAVSMIVDGDIVRDSSYWFHWLVDEAASSLTRSCPYEKYDVWGMMEPWNSKKKLKSGKVKQALLTFFQQAKVNIVRPETATKWGTKLQYLGPLSPGGLNTDILGMTAAGYVVKVHGFVAPVASTKCSAWRRAWDSWKPYNPEGWDAAVRALLQVLGAHKDDGVGGSIVISFIDTFNSLPGNIIKRLTNTNWIACARTTSANGLKYGAKVFPFEYWNVLTEQELWSVIIGYKKLGR